MVGASASAVRAGDDASSAPSQAAAPLSNEAMIKKFQAMEKRIQMLEQRLKEKDAATSSGKPVNGRGYASDKGGANNGGTDKGSSNNGGAAGKPSFVRGLDTPPPNTTNAQIWETPGSPQTGLKLGTYGEIKFGTQQNPAANGQWQNGFDMGRFVLLPTYQFSDNIILNAEIEFEHAGSGFDNDDKLHGTAEIEQAFIDFKISDYVNWRAPGVDLVPIETLNLFHEPIFFYSVQRPELSNGLIPTTWAAPATSIYGKIVDGLNYQIQISQSLEDYGQVTPGTDANTPAPFPTGYAPGIDGVNALGFAHAPLGDFRQMNNSYAVTGRLSYSPAFMPGFSGATAVYYSPNITPFGAYSDTGAPLGKDSLSILDTDFKYRVPNTGLELRGEYAQVWFGNPANLRANNDSDPTDNVGKTMYGASGEVAYHIKMGTILGSEWEAVPFYRYTYENLQTGGFAGTDLNEPTGQGQQQFHDVGIAVFPTPELVMKLNYTKALSRAPGGPQSDSVLGGLGWLF